MDVGLPFAALGSGGLAAMAVLEEGYKDTLSLEEGKVLVQRAVFSGIRNDLGSGSQVDLCVISPDGSSRHSRCVVPEEELEDVQFIDHSDAKQDEIPAASLVGVNGFGNTPFAIESTRQRIVSVQANKEEQQAQWNKALQL